MERPLAVPRGWSVLTVGASSDEIGGIGLRYGVLPRVELNVAAGATFGDGRIGPTDPVLGARLQLLRREPPNTSVAVDLRWRAPLATASPGLGAGISAARRWGPFLGTIGVEGWVEEEPSAAGTAEVLLQAGPLAPWVSAVGSLDGIEVAAGLILQLSRGLALHGAVGRTRSAAVEIAF